nr:hypothetical protein [Tanacetum cinerariifolium]
QARCQFRQSVHLRSRGLAAIAAADDPADARIRRQAAYAARPAAAGRAGARRRPRRRQEPAGITCGGWLQRGSERPAGAHAARHRRHAYRWRSDAAGRIGTAVGT